MPKLYYHPGALVIVVEKVRFLGYAGIGLMVVTGVVLTRLFSGIDLNETVLMEAFGYNNVCAYFDAPPSTYVLPFMWAATMTLWLTSILGQWLQMRTELAAGNMRPRLYTFLTRLKAFEAVTIVAFSGVFAVTPEGLDHTLYVHTTPFFLLQLGLVSLAMSNTLYGTRGGYWERLGMPSWFSRGAVVYCVVFAIVVALKIPMTINAMAGDPWWSRSDGSILFAKSLDRAFLLLAAVVPMVKTGYLLRTRGHLLERVRISLEPAKEA